MSALPRLTDAERELAADEYAVMPATVLFKPEFVMAPTFAEFARINRAALEQWERDVRRFFGGRAMPFEQHARIQYDMVRFAERDDESDYIEPRREYSPNGLYADDSED